jgi:phospholipase C
MNPPPAPERPSPPKRGLNLSLFLSKLEQELLALAKSLASRRRIGGGWVPVNAAPRPRLADVDHIIVLMMENRSFDHMLGYLALEGGIPGVDGLRPDMHNEYQGQTFPVHPLTDTTFPGEANPRHDGASVLEQLADSNGGFVRNFAEKTGASDPGLVMGYYTAEQLPVYDHLARNFTICERWFSSVPGATWPNRLYSVAGAAAGSPDDLPLFPYYWMKSFVRHLDHAKRSWRWYSYDPGTLRFIDHKYRLRRDTNFAFVEQRTPEEEIQAQILSEGSSLLDDIANDTLPDVAWIDPNFTDLHLFPHSNDDHPPADVTAGQELVLNIYRALAANPSVWAKSMLVIVYDEHGGLYDHVPPPEAPDDDAKFSRYGVRVPAIVVSPWSAAGFASGQLFDHTSLIKTILLRSCIKDGKIPNMGRRVSEANDLSVLLTSETQRQPPADHQAVADRMAGIRAEQLRSRLSRPPTAAARNPCAQLDDLQAGMIRGAQKLRRKGLPAGRP